MLIVVEFLRFESAGACFEGFVSLRDVLVLIVVEFLRFKFAGFEGVIKDLFDDLNFAFSGTGLTLFETVIEPSSSITLTCFTFLIKKDSSSVSNTSPTFPLVFKDFFSPSISDSCVSNSLTPFPLEDFLSLSPLTPFRVVLEDFLSISDSEEYKFCGLPANRDV